MDDTGKKRILGILILAIIVVSSYILLNSYRQPPEEIKVPESIQPIPLPSTELDSIASKSSKEIMHLEDGTWSLGDGYILTANAIDTNVRHVWLSLSKNGIQLDEKIVNEGETYTYNNSIKIKIAKIYVGANSQDSVTLTDESVASSATFP